MAGLTIRKTILVFVVILVFSTSIFLISASPVKVVILSHRAYIASPESYYIEGEVLNMDNQPRENITIEAVLFSSNGSIIGVAITNNPAPISPQEKSHFTIAYIDPQQVYLIKDYTLSISSTIASPLLNTPK
jgi:hypothetical protein